MTYRRVVNRNGLRGDYQQVDRSGGHLDNVRDTSAIAGDMRRLEQDSIDPTHVRYYALRAGVTDDQARALLTAFFAEFPESETWVRAWQETHPSPPSP